MWNERFSEPGYAYGTEPNEFLVSVAVDIDGTLWIADLGAQRLYSLDDRGKIDQVLDSMARFGP